jgi:sulfite reductase alpha subunit-like flavoprotein
MSFTLVYLSETGVGQTVGERIHKEAGAHGLTCRLHSAADFASVAWSDGSRVFVFIASSTGDGDPPDKAIKFWRWLKQPERGELFKGARFALLGLGDSNYSTFMGMPRRLHAQLVALGAEEFLKKTEADDATPSGLESTIEPWVDRLWPALKQVVGAAPVVTLASQVSVSTSSSLTHPRLADSGFAVIASSAPVLPSLQEPDTLRASIASARYLSSTLAVKTVVHMSLKAELMPAYEPGDAIYIRCPNPVEDVQYVHSRFSASEQGVVECSGAGAEFWPAHVPRVVESFQALSWYMDLGALPSKRLLRALAECCSESRDRTRLMDMCEISARGKELYAELAAASAGVVAVLRACPSCVPSMQVLLSLVTVMRPRCYSVASAHFANANQVDIVFTVFRRGDFAGACTTWLERLAKRLLPERPWAHRPENLDFLLSRQLAHWNNSREVLVPIRFCAPTRFRLTSSLRVPLIMVGPGTGVAPFRAFCQAIERSKRDDPIVFPETHLFFGCRNRHHDLLFGDEWERYLRDGVLTGLHIAASREDPGNVVYVQHLVASKSALIADALLTRGGFLFVCGEALSMAPAMERTVLDAFEKSGGLSPEAAAAMLKQLKETNRYCVDVWA